MKKKLKHSATLILYDKGTKMFSHYMECGLPAAFRIILPNESSELFWAISPNYSSALIKPSIVVKVINASSGRFSYPVLSKFFMV